MSNAMMKIGGIGAIIWLAAMILLLVAIYMLTNSGFSGLQTWIYVILASILIMAVGVLFAAIGSIGLWRQYANAVPLVAGIIGLIAAIMLLVLSIITIVSPLTMVGTMGTWMAIISAILLGVFLILLGVSFVIIRNLMGTELAMTTGILCLIGGVEGIAGVITALIVAGNAISANTGTLFAGGGLVYSFVMLFILMWVFFKGK